MALELVVKFLIILVVAGIVIGLFISSSNDAKEAFRKLFFPDEIQIPSEKPISKPTFSSGEVANYIESCYDSMTAVPETRQKDIVCYALMADDNFNTFTSVDEVSSAVSSNVKDKVRFNTSFQRAYIRIEFREIGNQIIIN